MRVIFLDIDGVLNSLNYEREIQNHPATSDDYYNWNMDQRAVRRLNRIVEKTGAVVVVSSAWRTDMGSVYNHLEAHGFTGKIVGSTPVLHRVGGVPRGDEIQMWLDEHDAVEAFVILDDYADMGALLPKLVKTDPWHGLQNEHVNMAIRMLQDQIGPECPPPPEVE
jgi:hypothetical protein